MSARAPRRVLYVEGNVDGTIGGSFFSLYFLARGLDRSRYEPIVVFAADTALIPTLRRSGIDTRVIAPTPPAVCRGRGGRLVAKAINFHRGFIAEPGRLARLLRAEKVALVHLNNSIMTNHVWMVAARRAGVPCVTHERGINEAYSQRSRWLGRRLDVVICISDAVRTNFEARGMRHLRLITIPNGLDPSDMSVSIEPSAIFREFGLPPTKRLVGIVGNIKEWKGQEVVVRAMARLADRHPDVICLLIGDSSQSSLGYRNRVERLIADSGLTNRISLIGYRANVPDYVNALDVLIHASIEPEPFGRVVLEGMALRKPVIGARGGGVPEIIQHGKTGLLYTPGSDSELADCLSLLLGDDDLRRSMGEAGYARLVSDFSIERNVQLTQQLYDSLLSRA
jgi:glycosyltransferase involved in cell wall biosynthesis